MKNRRLLVSVAATVLLICAVVLLRPHRKFGMAESDFWHSKVNALSVADVVVAGDSRVLHGISPEAMAKKLDVPTVLNFGFRSAPLNLEFLNEAKKAVKPDSPHRAIILGISVNSFTPKSVNDNGFSDKRSLRGTSVFKWPTWWNELMVQLRPIGLRDCLALIKNPGTKQGLYETFHADGWIEAKRIPEDENAAIPLYKTRFLGNAPDESIIQESIEFTRDCREQGITIMGVRMPVSEGLSQAEIEATQFDFPRYIERFRSAGGIWIEVQTEGLISYDGSHLRGDSAALFSERLALEVKPVLESRPGIVEQ